MNKTHLIIQGFSSSMLLSPSLGSPQGSVTVDQGQSSLSVSTAWSLKIFQFITVNRVAEGLTYTGHSKIPQKSICVRLGCFHCICWCLNLLPSVLQMQKYVKFTEMCEMKKPRSPLCL